MISINLIKQEIQQPPQKRFLENLHLVCHKVQYALPIYVPCSDKEQQFIQSFSMHKQPTTNKLVYQVLTC